MLRKDTFNLFRTGKFCGSSTTYDPMCDMRNLEIRRRVSNNVPFRIFLACRLEGSVSERNKLGTTVGKKEAIINQLETK